MEDIHLSLKPYLEIMKFLTNILGEHSEVVLHDLTREEHTIVAIENGSVSGRKVGDTPTNFILQVKQKKMYADQDYLSNYKAVGKDGRVFRSSSFFIKDDQQQLVGMLCVNTDISFFQKAKEVMDYFTTFSETTKNIPQVVSDSNHADEYLHGNLDDALESVVLEQLRKSEVTFERMSPDEKTSFIKVLYEQGVFLLKSSVHRVSALLQTSDPTVYRYLQKVKELSKRD
ncbi:helix-turn-helix transcriptional regulator [Bacillus massiliigorillae]|uniref:helix-turn-helix transcriptional regulator n=1 Tax=Bacillus massiliigorillae TaxID=1243664 RepID=UPI001E2B2D4A|nr:PAS domain-containing protein [Bacillus massiliigorillae]